MKKFVAFVLIFSSLLSGCTFNVEVLTPPPPVTAGSKGVPAQATSSLTQAGPSPVATVSATALSSPVEVATATAPVFTNARTSSSPQDADRQASFPAGTKQVYALWDYQNMRAGLLVRREWYWNGQLWLMREEPWDFDKYGASGTIRDISIYDNETGLNSGVYNLRLYIDTMPQPIGDEATPTRNQWITFEIGLEDATAGYGSLDNKWGVEVYGEKRIVLKNVATGTTTEIYTAREVPYVSWFNDSKHFLFVDRDRSGQKPGTGIGIRDDLWLVDVPGGAMHLLYKSDTSFNGRGGPLPSPDGKYIASLEGSGYADACAVDSRLIFLELAGDLRSVNSVPQEDFSGLPVFNDGSIYPAEDGYWLDGNSYQVTLDGTCSSDKSKLGAYTFNLTNRTATPSGQPSIPGDLGAGLIHGKVTDAVTGLPVANATVICEQYSYNAYSLCSESFTTGADGAFVFNNVYFHDTDTIKITVQAPGYQSQEITKSAFTVNDWVVNIALNRSP